MYIHETLMRYTQCRNREVAENFLPNDNSQSKMSTNFSTIAFGLTMKHCRPIFAYWHNRNAAMDLNG